MIFLPVFVLLVIAAKILSEVKPSFPLTLGFEADATSWLVLRGSVSQNVLINKTETKGVSKGTQANQTSVNAGATLNFGKLKVDGSIGNAAGTGNQTGVLKTDDLLTRVGVHYWF